MTVSSKISNMEMADLKRARMSVSWETATGGKTKNQIYVQRLIRPHTAVGGVGVVPSYSVLLPTSEGASLYLISVEAVVNANSSDRHNVFVHAEEQEDVGDPIVDLQPGIVHLERLTTSGEDLINTGFQYSLMTVREEGDSSFHFYHPVKDGWAVEGNRLNYIFTVIALSATPWKFVVRDIEED